jgi:hypothetical protein
MRDLPAVLACVLAVSGCARSSTMPLAQDTFQITASAAPVCGMQGAQRVAVRQAAVETIRRGYDRFLIMGAQGGQTVVGYTPVVVQSLGRGGAVASGGDPMIGHDQGLVVKMFRDNDPAGANAVSARDTLGPKWPELIKSDALTCVGD